MGCGAICNLNICHHIESLVLNQKIIFIFLALTYTKGENPFKKNQPSFKSMFNRKVCHKENCFHIHLIKYCYYLVLNLLYFFVINML